MLMIREEQMSALSQAMLKKFEKTIAIHLNINFQDETKKIPDDELSILIQKGIKQAEHYQIVLEYDVQRYLEFVITYGQNFEKTPNTVWTSKILHNKELNGTVKMNLIDEHELEMMRNLV